MSKSIKLKDNNYWDSTGVTYKRNPLNTIIDNMRKLKLLVGIQQSTIDIDNMFEGGIYEIATSLQTFINVPAGVSYGILIIIEASGIRNGAWQNTQIIFQNGNGGIFFRNRVNNRWDSWKKITSTVV